MKHAPYTQYKAYDHEDVDTDFPSDWVFDLIVNVTASLGIFAALMCALAFMMQIPDRWITRLILSVWGV